LTAESSFTPTSPPRPHISVWQRSESLRNVLRCATASRAARDSTACSCRRRTEPPSTSIMCVLIRKQKIMCVSACSYHPEASTVFYYTRLWAASDLSCYHYHLDEWIWNSGS
jgi:hypothetical protein